jgi:hypothetical protein
MKHKIIIAAAVFSVLGITATQYKLCGPLGRAADPPHECWQDGGNGQLVPCTEITERLAPSDISRTRARVQTCHEEGPAEHDQHG